MTEMVVIYFLRLYFLDYAPRSAIVMSNFGAPAPYAI